MQLKKMEQDDPAGFMCVNLALELAELHPGHAGAICLDCGPRSKLHTNEKCPNKQSSSSSMGYASAAEQAPRNGASSSQESAQGRTGGASEGSGKFRGFTKPEVDKSRAPRSFGYQRDRPSFGERGSSQSGCEFCGFAQGHESGVCYYKDPRAAPPGWPGPSDRTPVELVYAYLERCAQQQVCPHIRRCSATIEQLRTSGRLTKAMWAVLSPPRQDWDQQRRQAGAYAASVLQQSGTWHMHADPVMAENPWAREPSTAVGPPPGLTGASHTGGHPVHTQPAAAAAAAGSSSSLLECSGELQLSRTKPRHTRLQLCHGSFRIRLHGGSKLHFQLLFKWAA
jgi:hypothetical protein